MNVVVQNCHKNFKNLTIKFGNCFQECFVSCNSINFQLFSKLEIVKVNFQKIEKLFSRKKVVDNLELKNWRFFAGKFPSDKLFSIMWVSDTSQHLAELGFLSMNTISPENIMHPQNIIFCLQILPFV